MTAAAEPVGVFATGRRALAGRLCTLFNSFKMFKTSVGRQV